MVMKLFSCQCHAIGESADNRAADNRAVADGLQWQTQWQMDLEIVPMGVGARIMAFCGLAGGDERVTMSPRLKCELEHLQELYHIKGGEVPDKDFVLLIQEYTKELKAYADTHNGEWTPWLYELIETRYGFKPYKL